VWWTF